MASEKAPYPSEAPLPPGDLLAEEIEARGISQKDLARRMGRPLNAINEIINGKKAITPETALQLADALPGISARFWLNLETEYRLTRAQLKRERAFAADAPASGRARRAPSSAGSHNGSGRGGRSIRADDIGT